MKKSVNDFKMNVLSRSVNESFCRAVVGAFAALCDPTVEELSDLKTAVSEAVTNCIVHGYRDRPGRIYIDAALLEGNVLRVKIRDKGCGIEDVSRAMEPLFSTAGNERSDGELLRFCQGALRPGQGHRRHAHENHYGKV